MSLMEKHRVSKQLFCIIIAFSFFVFSLTSTQAKIGAYCGNCEVEKAALNEDIDSLNQAKGTLTAAETALDDARNNHALAVGSLEFAEQSAANAELAAGIAQDAYDYASAAIPGLEGAVYAARQALAIATSWLAIALAKAALIVAEAALATASALLSPLLAAALTAASVWVTAKLAIPPLKDQVIIANDNFEKALQKWGEAKKDVRNKEKQVDKSQKELDSCLDKITTAEECQKCENDKIIADDSQDPGMCLRCKNGSVANDNSENPGQCQKCQGGTTANDDSDSCDDGDSCTENDHCSGGACTGDAIISPTDPACQ